MLRAKEAEGVHVVARPCSETAHRGSVWQTGKAPPCCSVSLHQAAACCPSNLYVPLHFLQSKPGLEGQLEMAFDNRGHCRVPLLCHGL